MQQQQINDEKQNIWYRDISKSVHCKNTSKNYWFELSQFQLQEYINLHFCLRFFLVNKQLQFLFKVFVSRLGQKQPNFTIYLCKFLSKMCINRINRNAKKTYTIKHHSDSNFSTVQLDFFPILCLKNKFICLFVQPSIAKWSFLKKYLFIMIVKSTFKASHKSNLFT